MVATQTPVDARDAGDAPLPKMIVRDRLAVVLLAAGLAFGLLADWLFYDKPLGLNYAVFAALGLGLLVALAVTWRLGLRWSALALAAPVLFFAGAVAVRGEEFLTLLNIAASLGVLAILAYSLAGPAWTRLALVGFPLAAARAVSEAGFRPPVMAATAVDLSGMRAADRSRVTPVLRGLLLALPVLVVFAGLFSSADLVFQRRLSDLLRLDVLETLQRLARHGVFVVIAAWFVAGGLGFALRRAWPDDPRVLGIPARWLAGPGGVDAEDVAGLRRLGRGIMDQGVLVRPWARPRLGAVEANIVLAAVVLLFLAFVGIQATYLFGGQSNVTVEGFTYAEYARRGFFELVAVALLALGLGLGLLQVVRAEPGSGKTGFRLLLSALALLVLVVLASAYQRLALYEAAYGFTALRLYSHVFMVVLAGVVAWFVVTVWWKPERFAAGAFVAMIVFVAALDVINPDAVIVRQNVAQYAATGKLDTEYFDQLSSDAVPALAAALPGLKGTAHEETVAALMQQVRRLTRRPVGPWTSYHLGRERARSALAGLGLLESTHEER
jgi:hypothetical protein